MRGVTACQRQDSVARLLPPLVAMDFLPAVVTELPSRVSYSLPTGLGTRVECLNRLLRTAQCTPAQLKRVAAELSQQALTNQSQLIRIHKFVRALHCGIHKLSNNRYTFRPGFSVDVVNLRVVHPSERNQDHSAAPGSALEEVRRKLSEIEQMPSSHEEDGCFEGSSNWSTDPDWTPHAKPPETRSETRTKFLCCIGPADSLMRRPTRPVAKQSDPDRELVARYEQAVKHFKDMIQVSDPTDLAAEAVSLVRLTSRVVELQREARDKDACTSLVLSREVKALDRQRCGVLERTYAHCAEAFEKRFRGVKTLERSNSLSISASPRRPNRSLPENALKLSHVTAWLALSCELSVLQSALAVTRGAVAQPPAKIDPWTPLLQVLTRQCGANRLDVFELVQLLRISVAKLRDDQIVSTIPGSEAATLRAVMRRTVALLDSPSFDKFHDDLWNLSIDACDKLCEKFATESHQQLRELLQESATLNCALIDNSSFVIPLDKELNGDCRKALFAAREALERDSNTAVQRVMKKHPETTLQFEALRFLNRKLLAMDDVASLVRELSRSNTYLEDWRSSFASDIARLIEDSSQLGDSLASTVASSITGSNDLEHYRSYDGSFDSGFTYADEEAASIISDSFSIATNPRYHPPSTRPKFSFHSV